MSQEITKEYYEEQLRKAEDVLQGNLKTWEDLKKEYEGLEVTVKSLPDRTRHKAMIPIGSKAFFPGELIHTNELMVLLGDGYFVERSAKQTLEIISRRMAATEEKIDAVGKQLEDFETRKNFSSNVVDEENITPGIKDLGDGLGFILKNYKININLNSTIEPLI
eukprot:m.66529 g.66529  ORF g.66529 m.66529 type:complete len:164 (-) comp11813_c0_seq4:890-1381(-)